jgi:nitrate/nitrite-specific signal transduction histidine kinase
MDAVTLGAVIVAVTTIIPSCLSLVLNFLGRQAVMEKSAEVSRKLDDVHDSINGGYGKVKEELAQTRGELTAQTRHVAVQASQIIELQRQIALLKVER